MAKQSQSEFLQALLANQAPQIPMVQPQRAQFPVAGQATPRLGLDFSGVAERRYRDKEAEASRKFSREQQERSLRASEEAAALDREFSRETQNRSFAHAEQERLASQDYSDLVRQETWNREDTKEKKDRKYERRRDRHNAQRSLQDAKKLYAYQSQELEGRQQREQGMALKLDRLRRVVADADTKHIHNTNALVDGLRAAKTQEERDLIISNYISTDNMLSEAEYQVAGQMQDVVSGKQQFTARDGLAAIDVNLFARNLSQSMSLGVDQAEQQYNKRQEIIRRAALLNNRSQQLERAYAAIYGNFGSNDITTNDGLLVSEHPLVRSIRERVGMNAMEVGAQPASNGTGMMGLIMRDMGISENSKLYQAILNMSDPNSQYDLKEELDIAEAAIYDFANDLEMVVSHLVTPQVKKAEKDRMDATGTFFNNDEAIMSNNSLINNAKALNESIQLIKARTKASKYKWTTNRSGFAAVDAVFKSALDPDVDLETLQGEFDSAVDTPGGIQYDKDLFNQFAVDLLESMDDPTSFSNVFYDAWAGASQEKKQEQSDQAMNEYLQSLQNASMQQMKPFGG